MRMLIVPTLGQTMLRAKVSSRGIVPNTAFELFTLMRAVIARNFLRPTSDADEILNKEFSYCQPVKFYERDTQTYTTMKAIVLQRIIFHSYFMLFKQTIRALNKSK